MTLSTAAGYDLTCDDLQEICELSDDVYRNQWITFAYHKISERTRRYVGDDATWCTFARWSSYTVGKALDLEEESSRLEQMLERAHLDNSRLSWVRERLQDLNRDLRRLSDSAMPRTLAIGNHYVFHDIAYSMTKFLDWYEERRGTIARDDEEGWTAAWQELLPDIAPLAPNDLFQDADIELLRNGLWKYLDAIRDVGGNRSNHILHGNVLLAVYEQWRLDPILKLALDPVAKSLVEFRNRVPVHRPEAEQPQAVLRRRGTRWALRHQSAVRRWIADQYGQYLTQVWLTYDAPLDSDAITPLVVGKGFPTGSAADAVVAPELQRLLSVYDRNRRMRGSASWTRFADRMQFIVDLFREHRHNQKLHQEPPDRVKDLLRLQLSADALNELRQEGDDEADGIIDEYLARENTTSDPRELVQELVRYGWGNHPGGNDAGRAGANEMLAALAGPLPDWADEALIVKGQKFLERYALPIAAALFNGSLPMTYTTGHGTKVLTATADLASGNVNRRIAETGQMLLDLMVTNANPLAPGTTAGDAARGVRLFHAAIRRMLERNGWDPQEPAAGAPTPDAVPRGVPINQEDMIGTLIAFTVLVLEALDEMGIRVTDEDRDAYVHLWLVVGALLGIDYALLYSEDDPPSAGMGSPPKLTQLKVIGRVIYGRNEDASPDGQVLTAALMQMMRDSMKKWWLLHSVPSTTTRWLLHDDRSDLLGLPPAEAPARVLLRVSRPFLRFASVGNVGRAPAGPVRLNARWLYQKWIDEYDGDRAPWRVPTVKLKRLLKHPGDPVPTEPEIDLNEPEPPESPAPTQTAEV